MTEAPVHVLDVLPSPVRRHIPDTGLLHAPGEDAATVRLLPLAPSDLCPARVTTSPPFLDSRPESPRLPTGKALT